MMGELIPLKFLRPDTKILIGLEPVDSNDPEGAKSAIEFNVPDGFSDKAKALMEYLDGAGFIFAYKDKLVVTDESLELTPRWNSTHEYIMGTPRFICDSWDELEKLLEQDYDGMKADGLL